MAEARRRRASSDTFEIECDPLVELGDYVYLDSNDKVVKKALANSLVTMPAIGRVVKKKSPTLCVVSDSLVEAIDDPVVPNGNYFISDTEAGKLRYGPPTDPDTVLQLVAKGISDEALLVKVQFNNIVVRS